MIHNFFAGEKGYPDAGTSQRNWNGRTRRIDKTVSSVLRKELKADPNWAEAGMTDFETSGERRSLRPRQQKCYAEADLPDLDLYLFCDDCDVCLLTKQYFKSG